jgi:hypothetical protein
MVRAVHVRRNVDRYELTKLRLDPPQFRISATAVVGIGAGVSTVSRTILIVLSTER